MSVKESRLRKLRKQSGLSGIVVAQKLGITPQYYYDIEKGERRLTTEIAAKLADIFKTTVDYLLGKTDVNLYDWLPDEFNNENEKTPSQDGAEKEFFNDLDLSDEELRNKYRIMVDGRELTDKEWKKLLAIVRLERQLDED